MTIYQVPEENIESLESKIEALNKKAIKFGFNQIQMVVGEKAEEFEHPEYRYIVKYYEVEIIGEAPVIKGWSFVARIEHTDDQDKNGNYLNEIYSISEIDVPNRFRTSGQLCEHCNIDRFRNKTYILHNQETGEFKQVGSSCLKDFLGNDPHHAASMSELLWEIKESLADDFNEPRTPQYISLEYYLAHVINVMDKKGWVSRSKAELGQRPTADLAIESALGTKVNPPIQLSQNFYDESKEIVQFLQDHFSKIVKSGGSINDYEWNLYTMTESESLKIKMAGYAASMVNFYRKLQEKLQKDGDKVSNHFAQVGDIVEIEWMKLVFATAVESYYGVSTLLKFQDKSGNLITWFTSSDKWSGLEVGSVIKGTFQVKENSFFNNERQTVVKYKKQGKLLEGGFIS